MMVKNQNAGSRRWQHFQNALQIAVRHAAHKWTYEDFSECFPQYVQEDKNGSMTTFNSIADYIEQTCLQDLEQTFQSYDLQANIDSLNKIVTEAKERKASGNEPGNDTWREDLKPGAGTTAKITPLLEAEAARLRETLATMQGRTSRVQAELEETLKATEESDARANALLDGLDSTLEKWKEVPIDQIEAWTLQMLEVSQPNHPG